jgi:hypothetical protein
MRDRSCPRSAWTWSAFSFAAPQMRRNGPFETNILARIMEGWHLHPDAIIAVKWFDIALVVAFRNLTTIH